MEEFDRKEFTPSYIGKSVGDNLYMEMAVMPDDRLVVRFKERVSQKILDEVDYERFKSIVRKLRNSAKKLAEV